MVRYDLLTDTGLTTLFYYTFHRVAYQFSSVQFSHSVVSDSLWPCEPQHARPPCPSPTPGVHPNPCPLSQWCHPTISSSVVPFSSCPQSFPASGSFPMSQFFTSGGQSIGVSASTPVLPMNTQDWSVYISKVVMSHFFLCFTFLRPDLRIQAFSAFLYPQKGWTNIPEHPPLTSHHPGCPEHA